MTGNYSMSQPKCDPLTVAKEYIAKRYPSFDPTGKKLVISETSTQWQITYELPPHMLGGVPIITVEKRTCTIIRAEHTQ
jgi:hypothetical protein